MDFKTKPCKPITLEKEKCNCISDTDKCLDCKYAYIDNLYYKIQCKKHNMLIKDCEDFKVDH